MSSRGAGAGIALIAAALLAVSIATPLVLPGDLALFSGHPTVGGHMRRTQEVYVGLVSAELCNTGGDGRCSAGADQEKSGFRLASYGALGATGLLGLGALALVLLTLRNSERRKGAATLVRFASVLAMGGAVALIVQGPFNEASIPIGLGMPLYAAGILAALIASVLAVRAPPPLKLRVADRGSQPVVMQAPPRAQAFDHQAVRGDDRPPGDGGRKLRPRRDLRSRPAAPPSAGGPPVDAAPVAPSAAQIGEERTMLAPGQQLRPLYDAAPQQGGTGGLLPVERPPVPTRPPTPIARAAISAIAGIPTPQSVPAEAEPAPALPPSFGPRSKPSSVPPPPVPSEAELAPTLPPSFAPRGQPPSVPPPSAAVSMPGMSMPGPPMIAVPAPTGPLRTQISFVPPMPDNDLPIAPPTAQIMSERPPDGVERPSSSDANVFRRPETPLAPPPPPAASPRARRDSQLPRPHRESQPPPRSERDSQPPPHSERDSQLPRPPLRAAVPMPVRPPRSAPSPTRPPLPAHAPTRNAPPRPTIPGAGVSSPFFSTMPGMPGIPAIPAIPPLPPPSQRATTDPDEQVTLTAGDLADIEQATVARAPLEFGDTSQTDVSFGMSAADEEPGAPRGFAAPDTSPTAEPVMEGGPRTTHSTDVDGEAVTVAARGADIDGEALTIARGGDIPDEAITMPARARPTGAPPPSPPPRVAAVAPPIAPVRARAMPSVLLSTAPDSLPPPRDEKQSTGPSPACPQCESPMSWIEEHLRFYCKSCRMYF